MGGWVAVDLDGTLAKYHGWNNGVIGAPVPAMVRRVTKWLEMGVDVRIFTARVAVDSRSPSSLTRALQEEANIKDWCLLHLGTILPVTCQKDFEMIELWDDQCRPVELNTGRDLLAKE